jgi:hypothetical protein
VLLAGACGSLAFAGTGPKRHDKGDRVRVLHVTLTDSTETDLDLGAGGASVGDRFIVFGTVVKHGEPVGPGGYECVTMLFAPGSDPAGPPHAATDQCTGTLAREGPDHGAGAGRPHRTDTGRACDHRRHRRLPDRARHAGDLGTQPSRR